MPHFGRGVEGEGLLSLADLRQMQDTHRDAQLIKSLKAAGVNARRIKQSMAQLAATDPLVHQQLSLALRRNRVILDGQLDKKRLKQLITAGEDYHDMHERFEKAFWGMGGKVVEFCKRHSPTALAVWALKQQFGKDGVFSRMLAVNLKTAGNAADNGRLALLQQSVRFAAVEANISEQLTRYGLDHHKAGKMTDEFTRYFGDNEQVAKQVFARLAGSAKMANADVGEMWNIVIEQQQAYGRGALQTAVDLHLNVKLFRGVAHEIASNEMLAHYAKGDSAPNIWPQLMTESLVKWHKSTDKVGTNLKAAGLLVAEAYQQAAKHGKAQGLVQREADAYVHLAHGTSWMRASVGIKTLDMIERKVKEVQAAKIGISWAEASREVLLARYGQDQLPVAESIFDLFVRGDRANSPEAIMKLDESLDKTMLSTATAMQEQWEQQSNDAIYMHMTHLGVDNAAAAGVVLTVRAGGLAQAQTKNAHLAQHLDNNRERLKESAEFLVDTDVTATTSIQRVMAMCQQFIATPLGKLAASTGMLGVKLALDGFYRIRMMADWFRAGFAYARMAGLTSVTGLMAFVRQELSAAGMIAQDLRALAGTAGRIAVPTALGATATYSAANAATWRVKEADAQAAALRIAAPVDQVSSRLPSMARVDQLSTDPDKLLDRYDKQDVPPSGMSTTATITAGQPPPEVLHTGGLRHPVKREQPLLITARQYLPQPPAPAGTAGPQTPPATRLVQYQPRTEREAALVASGIPLTATGRVAISTLAQIESSRRQKEFRNLWLSAMGGDIHTSETGRTFVLCRFDGFSQLVAGVPIAHALSVSRH